MPGSPQGQGCLAGLALLSPSPLPSAALPLLPPPRLCPPAQPHGSSSSPQQLGGVLGKRAAPPSHQIPSPLQPRAGWMLAGMCPILGRTKEPGEPPSWGKHPGGLGEVHLHALLCREGPLSCSLPMTVPEERVLPHGTSIPLGRPRSPGLLRGTQGMLVLAMLTSFSFPFLQQGSKALCSPCAPGKPGGQVHAAPPCPDPGVPGGSWGAAAPGSPRLLSSSRSAQGRVSRGERGGRRGVGK